MLSHAAIVASKKAYAESKHLYVDGDTGAPVRAGGDGEVAARVASPHYFVWDAAPPTPPPPPRAAPAEEDARWSHRRPPPASLELLEDHVRAPRPQRVAFVPAPARRPRARSRRRGVGEIRFRRPRGGRT